MPDCHVAFTDLLHAANLRHGTNGFTSLSKEVVLRIFFALKNPTASAGFEPANLGTKGQHATPRPPKPPSTVFSRNKQILKILTLFSKTLTAYNLQPEGKRRGSQPPGGDVTSKCCWPLSQRRSVTSYKTKDIY
jgi:hypothetical protein